MLLLRVRVSLKVNKPVISAKQVVTLLMWNTN